MTDYKIGAHILESLTTGMYKDSRTIFREYIQNACDAIDSAVKHGVLSEGDGEIRVEIDADARNITIEDNGTGIRAEDFVRVMGNVADSDKRQDENRGFRGIGRLCGMGYCASVVFTAKFAGEGVVSRLTCNAKILREFLNERNSGIKHYSAVEVLNEVNEFSCEETRDVDAHYFRVELVGINLESGILLDYGEVKKYLESNAPLPYGVGFSEFDAKIHAHAESLGFKISEYMISLNGDQLFKAYARDFATSLGSDEVFGLEFHDFIDDNNTLIAWIWFGVSCFKGVIKKGTSMRGIRLRKKNRQIGNDYTLQKLFDEDRGINYFIGEVFCVSEGLELTSDSDYFIENPARHKFESQPREYFMELKKVYYDSSRVNNLFKRVDGTESGKKALAEINKFRKKGGVIRRVIERIESERSHEDMTEYISSRRRSPREAAILQKVFDIIESIADPDTAEEIITQIRNTIK